MPLRFVRHMPISSSVLLWYLRGLAVVYFLSGLSHWGRIVGMFGGPFDAAAAHVQVATVYFAVLEVVAAVGLWAGAAWGVAAWLFAAVAVIVMHVGFTDLFGLAWLSVMFHVLTILAYIGLAWWTGSTDNPREILRLPPD